MARYVDIEPVVEDVQKLRGCYSSPDRVVDEVEMKLSWAPTAEVIDREEYDYTMQAFRTRNENLKQKLMNSRSSYDKLENEITELEAKINKAIEEITELSNQSTLPTVNKHNRYSEGLRDSLDILKRNLGGI